MDVHIACIEAHIVSTCTCTMKNSYQDGQIHAYGTSFIDKERSSLVSRTGDWLDVGDFKFLGHLTGVSCSMWED